MKLFFQNGYFFYFFTPICIFSLTVLGSAFEIIDRHDRQYVFEADALCPKEFSPVVYEEIPLMTADGMPFSAYYVNNNSDTVVVFGHGFQNNYEHVKGLAEILNPHYDLIIFNYRWANQLNEYMKKRSNFLNPTSALLLCEKDEIRTVVSHVRATNKYKKIIGLGQCYSAFTFVLAQAEAVQNNEQLFDKIILDSCFYSVSDLLKNVLKDPFLPFNSKKGGFPRFLRRLLISSRLISIIDRFFILTGKHFPLSSYLNQIGATPILFFHGERDKLVPSDSFKKIWKATHGDKTHISTPFCHIENFRNSGAFEFLCRAFIDCPDADHSTYLVSSSYSPLNPYLKQSLGVRRRYPRNFFGRITKRLRNYWRK